MSDILKTEQQYKAQVDPIKALRLRVRRFFEQRWTIDKLMSEKVEDTILMEELPLPIRVGDRTIYVGNFTIKNQNTFFQLYAEILAVCGAQIANLENAIDLIAKPEILMQYLHTNNKLFKMLCKMIDKTILKKQEYFTDGVVKARLRKCSLRYFMNNITKEKLIQICWLIFLYNFDAEKKNLRIIMEKMGATGLSETYMYSWLVNLAGMSGKFSASRLINVDYWSDESLNDQIGITGNKN